MNVVTAPASVVPDLASDLVESFGRPGHGVEGVESDDGVGAVEADHVVDPAGAVGADVGDPQRATPAELAEEAVKGVLVSAFGHPDQAPAVVIHDHGEVAVAFAE